MIEYIRTISQVKDLRNMIVILSCFCNAGYQLLSVIGYYGAIQSNNLADNVLILRYDVDSDAQRAYVLYE